MRVLAAADLHGRPDRFDRVREQAEKLSPDVLVLAGDILAPFGSGSVLDRLWNAARVILAVSGNTDLFRKTDLFARHGIRRLDDEAVVAEGIRFVGAGGCVPLPFASRIALAERARGRRLLSLLDESSVFIVHPPPRGTLDAVGGRFSAGSSLVARIVDQTRPRLVLCGHIHESAGIADRGSSLVVNCAVTSRTGGVCVDIPESGPVSAAVLPEAVP